MTRTLLTTLFAGSIVLANILAAKLTWADLPAIGGVAIPAGFIAFGVAYLVSDLIVELHGRDVAHDVVNGTIATLIVGYGLIALAMWLPTAPFWQDQAAFETILGSSASVTLGSIVALSVSQHLDVRLFDGLRRRTQGRHRWIRNCGSTGISQAVDTVLFISLAFAIFPALGLGGTATWGWDLATIIAGQYIVKLAVATLDTPVFYLVTELTDATPAEEIA
jgi:uncharacterized integral membrane protein (TIGR00697 family)